MFVKICGITNEEDALMAVALGANAVGFVFAPSPRQVSVTTASDIIKRLPPDLLPVGVFRDADPRTVIEVVRSANLKGVQLHGHETPAMAAEIRPHARILIVAMPAGDPALDYVDDYRADALLLDSHAPGSGKAFDWSLAEGMPSNRRVILAGGLTPENVAEGVAVVHPWGVDVSSGVESTPGRKDALKVTAFVRNARAAGSRVAVPPESPPPFDWLEEGL